MDYSNSVVAVKKFNDLLGLGNVTLNHIPDGAKPATRKAYIKAVNEYQELHFDDMSINHKTMKFADNRLGSIPFNLANTITEYCGMLEVPDSDMHPIIKNAVIRASVDYALDTYTGVHDGLLSKACGYIIGDLVEFPA